jgi:hypothetical protein
LIEKGVDKFLTSKSQEIINKYTPSVSIVTSTPQDVSKKAQEILTKYVDEGATNINRLIDGSGCKASQNAIAIQDLVKKLNGAGLKAV